MKAGLRRRLWRGFFLSAGLALLACGVGIARFSQIEESITDLNESQMPYQKALSQAEGAFSLLEFELDRIFLEDSLRPREAVFADWDRRWPTLAGATELREEVEKLASAVLVLRSTVDAVYSDWPRRHTFENRLSEERATARASLRSLVRAAEARVRASSERIQGHAARSGLLVAGILAASFVILIWLARFLVRTLRPLERLAQVARRVSEQGLRDEDVADFSALSHGNDEVGVLGTEMARMASSLRDRTRTLQQQQQVLEKAHQEMTKQNEELRNARDKLAHQEKLALAGRLAAQMAHEVRNPLNALGLHLEVLEHEMREKGVDTPLLSPVKREVERLARVTDGHLEMARAPRFQSDRVDVPALLATVADTWAPLFQEKGVRLLMEKESLPSASIDQGSFSQVMGNLLKNALEAFDEKGAGLKFVRVTGQKQGSSLVINVMDNGTGIRSEVGAKLFEPFFTTKAQGTGLGLAHCRQLLQQQGGDISFESVEGQGTKFTLRLPLVESHREGVGDGHFASI
ncbi:MAG: GHKL domain-containing protein [Bdellovibrionales bacterium]|nr:GHKL domain-containing protein [Bdellovibrionales bacterium]